MRCCDNQMTLGELIATLKRKDQDRSVTFGFDYARPSGVGSYRGYYEDLAIGYKRCADCTVATLLLMLQDIDGKTLTGWKGGDYTMDSDTVLWMANPGESCSMAIVDVIETPYQIWLKTELAEG